MLVDPYTYQRIHTDSCPKTHIHIRRDVQIHVRRLIYISEDTQIQKMSEDPYTYQKIHIKHVRSPIYIPEDTFRFMFGNTYTCQKIHIDSCRKTHIHIRRYIQIHVRRPIYVSEAENGSAPNFSNGKTLPKKKLVLLRPTRRGKIIKLDGYITWEPSPLKGFGKEPRLSTADGPPHKTEMRQSLNVK